MLEYVFSGAHFGDKRVLRRNGKKKGVIITLQTPPASPGSAEVLCFMSKVTLATHCLETALAPM